MQPRHGMRLLCPLCLCVISFNAACSDQPANLTIALLQMTPEADNITANFSKAERFCRKAAAKQADIALMPEMWSIGYTRPDPEQPGAWEAFTQKALRKDSAAIQRFAALARELNMAIGVTYLEEHPTGLRNALTLFDRHGSEAFTYAKVHTSDFKPMEAAMTPGTAFYTAPLDTRKGIVTVGAMICFDREQPESARILMLQGAEIILTPNACRLDTLRIDQFKVRAFENLTGVAMTNYPGAHYEGRSVAFTPDGKCLVQAGKREGLYYATFDLNKIRAQRAKSIWGNAYRRPHRYTPLISLQKAPIWLRLDPNGTPYDAAKR